MNAFPDFFVYPLFAVVLFLAMVFAVSAAALAVLLVADLIHAVAGWLRKHARTTTAASPASSRAPA